MKQISQKLPTSQGLQPGLKSQEAPSSTQIGICSRRRRFFAYILDTIILSVLINLLRNISEAPFLHEAHHTITFSFVVLPWVITFLYFSLFPIYSWWATPGQKIMNTYICDATTLERIGLVRSCVRTLLLSILWMVSFCMTSIVLVGLDFNKIKHTFTTGMQYKQNLIIGSDAFYNDTSTYLISFHDQRNNKHVQFMHPLSSVAMISDKDQSTILTRGTIYNIARNKDVTLSIDENDNVEYQNTSTNESDVLLSIFVLMIKIVGYSIVTFMVLLIFPTTIGNRKQTLYDMICNTTVVRGDKS